MDIFFVVCIILTNLVFVLFAYIYNIQSKRIENLEERILLTNKRIDCIVNQVMYLAAETFPERKEDFLSRIIPTEEIDKRI